MLPPAWFNGSSFWQVALNEELTGSLQFEEKKI
jgi:hypothetical protein